MSERDGGLSKLDADRAHSMEDEGGASAAMIERQDAEEAGRVAGAAMACLVGLLAGVGLMSLLRSR